MPRATPLIDKVPVSATDYRCDAGPHDKPYAELHRRFSLAYVRRGSFGYRYRGHAHELVAGSVLVGHAGDEFVCTHDHHAGGDECLSFHFPAETIEWIGAQSAQTRAKLWRTGGVPPLPELIVFGELAQAVADGRADGKEQEPVDVAEESGQPERLPVGAGPKPAGPAIDGFNRHRLPLSRSRGRRLRRT